VQANFESWGQRFEGHIDKKNRDGTLAVQFEDGDYEDRRAGYLNSRLGPSNLHLYIRKIIMLERICNQSMASGLFVVCFTQGQT
jgi:hypothetical protein